MQRAEKTRRTTLKKYFIPHEENDHKPHILRARSVAFVLVVALAVEAAFVFGTTQLAPNSSLFGIILVNSLIDGTNASRVAASETPLVANPLLMAAAQMKANDMVANDYFAHTSPSGLTPWYWFAQVGYNFEYAGENLAVNFSDSQDVTTAWMNSPEHRANILDANFTQIGMATATGTYEGHPAVYVVELFGAPVPPAPPAELPIAALVNSAAAAGAQGSFVGTTTASIGKAASETLAPPTVIATSVTSTASGVIATARTLAGSTPVETQPQSNPIQNAAADPRQIVDYMYLAIIALFALALGLNIFIKIRIQHPQVIFGGMIVILVAGLFIVLNQHLLAGAAIL